MTSTGNFGSGSNISHSGFTATVLNPGSFAEELPTADVTPISQTNGAREMAYGLVKTIDPITLEILFDPDISTLPTDVASGTITYTVYRNAQSMTLAGPGRITRWEMGPLVHDDAQKATITVMFTGGATPYTHTQGSAS